MSAELAAQAARSQAQGPLVLLTGASGYVGGRLIRRLEERGIRLRCLARTPEFLAPRVAATTDVVQGDVLRADTLGAALRDVHTAYYLVHSMGSVDQDDFEEQDRLAARNFADAARTAGVTRIVYLGGLGEEAADLSPHLRSRQEVGRILRESGATVIEFRASIVIGSGSLSFEMLCALVDRLPMMVTPRWVDVQAQPIAIGDLLAYLEAALELSGETSRVYEIGGEDRVSYGQLMREYARLRGLRRIMVPVPVLTPGLSSLWLGLVTPLYARIGRILIESICHETVVHDDGARRDFAIKPVGVREALARALVHEDQQFAETRWSDAMSSSGPSPRWFGKYGGVSRGRRLVDSRSCNTRAAVPDAFRPVRRIGGGQGWYGFNWLWRVRGFLDLLVGGVGLRRGRRDPEHLRVGDTLDWWRVEAYEPNHLLRLRAEMKLPGRAWLEFEVTPNEEGGSTVRQTAVFDPKGLFGLLYWYGIYPLHAVVFAGMLKGIVGRGLQAPKRNLS